MPRAFAVLVVGGLLATACVPASQAADPSVQRFRRFELSLQSSVDYRNPVQDASLTATFTSTGGAKVTVPGFWDGSRTWRVRFTPTQMGKWTFETTCSDASDGGLHGQTGGLDVTAAAGANRFDRHGPVRVAGDGRSFVHDDGTPFFWLGDTAWSGPLLSTTEEWNHYLNERARQGFTAVQWVATQYRAAPDGDRSKQLPYSGTDRIAINPSFYQRLDDKVEAANRAGLLSVPVMLWAIRGGGNPGVNPGVSLPEDQAILLARYMAARWAGSSVAWFLAGDGNYMGANAEKWRRVGRAVFGDIAHGPVTMHPGGMHWVWKEFIKEPWYGFVGYQSGHGDDDRALRWMQEGPPTTAWTESPHKPFVNLEPPYENHIAYQSKTVHTAASVRRAVYWSLLGAPPAGVTYGGHGVWGWDDGTKVPVDHPNTGTPMPWRKALTMPAAEQMKHVAQFFGSIDFWRLRPAPAMVRIQPGAQAPARFVAAAATEHRDLVVLYVPEDRSVEVKLGAITSLPAAEWFNPRTGARSRAPVAASGPDALLFTTPGEGDWLLVVKHTKRR